MPVNHTTSQAFFCSNNSMVLAKQWLKSNELAKKENAFFDK